MTPKHVAEKIKYLRDFHTAISGKWKLAILITINHGEHRFKDIKASIPKITSRVLSKELKDLQENLMITRTVRETYPVSIEYRATPYSLTMKPVIEMMVEWGKKHRKKISGK